jgi:hypothetical protein
MAYTPHALVVIGGSLTDGTTTAVDQWQCTMRVSRGGDTSVDHTIPAPDQYIAAVKPGIATWWAHAQGTQQAISSTARLEWIKCNNIDAAGHYQAANTSYISNFSPQVSGSTGSACPTFVTVAISWTTASQRGPASHGRVYLPFSLPNSGGSPTITAGAQNAFLAAGKAFLSLFRSTDATNGDVWPVVASRVNGKISVITGVRVGNVMDTQVRRKHQVPETYVAGVWP